jgi:hypothetical protein
MTDELAGKPIDIGAFEIVKFSALKVEDGRALDHADVGAIAVENIAAHDRSPGEAPAPSCACWAQIARQFARQAGTLGASRRHRQSQRRQFSPEADSEQLAPPVKKVWSILMMARVYIKGIEGL